MTNPDRFRQLDEIFRAAREMAPETRRAYLERRCADDRAMQNEVEELLRNDERRHTLLDSPLCEASGGPAAALEATLPESIGGYAIQGLLGIGGMGVVYRARQDRPRRDVALKVLRPLLVTPQVLRRFEQEAQVLGLLQHPGIAQIFEAGTADEGSGPQPFFAMELIPGRPITAYAEAHGLSTRRRLELLARVCDAVQHAHQNGVVHRDLKPGNVLVAEATERGSDGAGKGGGASADAAQPKILDFGVARMLDSDVQLATLQTDVGQVVGTVPYMSPEQVAGDPAGIDTRCDVYALGVIAYELLTGRLPHEVRGVSLPEAARIIRDDEHTRLSSVDRSLRGDLETIVGKALEKDRDRRYDTASELAADIRRFLGDEPIVARPASAAYQLRKFARRNRALVGGVVAVIAVLAASTVGMAVLLARAVAAEGTARLEAERAMMEASRSDQVSKFSREILSTIDPREALDRDTTLIREILDEAWSAASTDGRRRAWRDNLSTQLYELGRYEETAEMSRQILAVRERVLGATHPETLNSMNNLATVLGVIGRFEEAEATHARTLELRRQVLGPEHKDTLISMSNLADMLRRMERYEEAEQLLDQTIEIRTRVLGARHPDTLFALNNLSVLLSDQGRTEEAIELLTRVVEARREVLGPGHPETLVAAYNLAMNLKLAGRLAEADVELDRLILTARDALPADHWYLGVMLGARGGILRDLERHDAAEPLLLESFDILEPALGLAHERTQTAVESLIALYEQWGRPADAERWEERTHGEPAP